MAVGLASLGAGAYAICRRYDGRVRSRSGGNGTTAGASSVLVGLADAAGMTGLQRHTIGIGMRDRGIDPVMRGGESFYPVDEVLMLRDRLRREKSRAFEELDGMLREWGL